jgi:hypothetical protein
MLPGPLTSSPPANDQITSAGLPFVSVAANCITEPPLVLVALHPVQLVSISAIPGATKKAGRKEFAVPIPLPHPAARNSAGARNSGKYFNNSRIGIRLHPFYRLRSVE